MGESNGFRFYIALLGLLYANLGALHLDKQKPVSDEASANLLRFLCRSTDPTR